MALFLALWDWSRDHATFRLGTLRDRFGDLRRFGVAPGLHSAGTEYLGIVSRPRRRGRQPAGRQVCAILCHRHQIRLVRQAAVHHVPAPGMEGTAGRQVNQARWLASDRLEPVARRGAARYGLEQAFRIWVMRGVEDIVLARLLRGP